MAVALRDYGFRPEESYSAAASTRPKTFACVPVPVKGRQPIDIGPYTQIPNRFFGSGMAARLGPSAGYVYLALCEHANRNGDLSFKASDKALASETTIAPRTISNARKKLIEYGLISSEREKGQSHTYTLLKPSWEWKPLKERLRRTLKPRALHASRAPQVFLIEALC
jgi:Helix-turn-helix domain